MAHNLANAGGKTAMFYSGERPWHGLGTAVEGALTSAEAIKAAGLDWNVDEVPVYLEHGAKISGYKGLRRADTGTILHVCRDSYHPIQNRDAFKFFDRVTGTGAAKYVTAGALGDGGRVWILANAHDGSLACWIMATSIRVVCQNTLSISLAARGESTRDVRILHRAGATDRVAETRDQLGLALKYYDAFGGRATPSRHGK